MTVIGLVVVAGADAIDDTSADLDVQRAETLLTQFDAKSAIAALGSTDSQRVDFPQSGEGTYRVRPGAGWLNVTMVNRTDESTRTMLNVTLGAVVYEGSETSIAYQGGGVWKRTPAGATMVTPPEFHYRGATLILPVILVRGTPSLSGGATVEHLGTVQQFPNATADDRWVNPLVRRRVNVTVHSAFYEAWGAFFERRTEGEVALDHENRTATATLVTPPGNRTIGGAVAATSAAGEIRVSGNGARTDSYNSSDGGRYSTTSGANGTITAAGYVYVGGDGSVLGTIRSGGSVKVTGNGYVDGDVQYTTSEHVKESQVTGGVTQIDGVQSDGPIETYVELRNESIRTDNDNGATSAIDGNELDIDGGSATLGPGDYYLDNVTVENGDALVIETGTENVSILVENYVTVADNSTIEVRGEGRVNVFIEGSEPDPVSKADFTIAESGGAVDVPAENSTMLWIYGNRDFEARIEGSDSAYQRFEGVIYAPGGSIGNSSFYIKHGELYGGVVTSSVRLDQGGIVHYDRKLRNAEVLPADLKLVRVTYLHVTTNRIGITD